MRRRFVLIVMSLLMITGFSVMPSSGLQKTETVTLEFWTISLRPFFTTYVNKVIAEFERQNPGIKIKWEDVQFSAVEQKLLAALAGGIPPDVVNLNTEMAIRFAAAGALTDLDDPAVVPLSEKRRYFKNLWESARYGGRTYGIPWYVAPPVVAYNEDIYRRAGLDPNFPPATEDEIIRHARQIQDRLSGEGVYGFMPNIGGIGFLHRFQERGLPILSSGGKKAVFNSRSHAKYVAKYLVLYKQDYFPEDTFRRGYLGATERYSAGQLGILITGPQFLLRVKNDGPQVYTKTRVTTYPLSRVIHLPVMVLSIPKTSRNQAAAVKFALFVTNDQNQLEFAKQVVILPSTRGAARDPFFTAPGQTPEDEARRLSARSLPRSRDLTVVVPNSGDLLREFKFAIESAFLGEKPDPSKSLEEWALEIAQKWLDYAVKKWNEKLP